jgi:type II secretory pathway predicted ATPase ExeA
MVASSGRPVILSPAQEAALGRIRFGLEQPQGIVLLCGPAGAGTSTVLAAIAAELSDRQAADRGATAGATPGPLWSPATLLAEHPRHVLGTTALLVDDSHLATADECSAIAALSAAGGDGSPGRCLVLGGRGRLLTLVGRDSRLASRVRLRAIVPPFGIQDTRRIVETRLGCAGDDVVQTCHEITGGIAASLVRLLELAAVMAAGRQLTADDLETIHSRLDPHAL